MEEKQRFSGVGWLSSRLSRKLIALILVLAVASWLAMCAYFLAYLGRYTGQAYDGMVESAQDTALRAAAYLEGCGGDYELFGTWLSGEGFGASVQTKEGERLFDQAPAGLSHGLTAGAWAPASLPGGTVRVAVQVPAMARQELTRSVTHSAFLGLLLLNLWVFAGAALLIFSLMVAPIGRLRKTMRRYYESGTRPERTDRADEIGRLQNTFADLAGIVDRKEKAERQLIASISHDIKTPLTSVLGYSERLLSPGLPPEKERSYLQSVHEKAVAIQSIVDEFDDYIDVGLRDTAPMGLMTAEELCARLLQEYEGELADTGVGFRVECQCPGDRLLCNWEHMRRFFGNLIGNSIQHAGAERLSLSLTCRREGGQVVFLFSDNGKGVPEELLDQIFEPLYTSDRGRKVSGLGLSICKSIITAHGGAVSAFDLPGGGLSIRAALPALDR